MQNTKEKIKKVIVPRALYQLGVEIWGIKYMRKWYLQDRKVKSK